MDKCPICLDVIDKKDKTTTLNCSHIYHAICIDEWLKRAPICPLCKRLVETKFRIYTQKTKCFRNYLMLCINTNDNDIVVYKINKKKKIILNPCVLRLRNNPDSTHANDLLKKNEQIGEELITIDIKSITLISFVFKTKRLIIKYDGQQFSFYFNRSKLQFLFNILKRLIDENRINRINT